MKKCIGFLLLAGFSVLIACNDQSIEDLEVTSGQIAGQEWRFDTGRALQTFNGLEIILMSDEIKINNPCPIQTPSTPYAKILIPAKRGTFNVSAVAGNNNALVQFYEGSSSAKNLTAVSGYVQVISLSDFTVDGIIDVHLNEENTLKYGAFFIDSCN